MDTDTRWNRRDGGQQRLARDAGKVLLLAAALVFTGLNDAAAELSAIKMGWTYQIGFPEALNDPQNPRLGLSSGMNPYRVLASGGDGWYRLQRVVRHPNGGWVAPQGTPSVWVNMGYAYAIKELQ